jgi:hypothetical protein
MVRLYCYFLQRKGNINFKDNLLEYWLKKSIVSLLLLSFSLIFTSLPVFASINGRCDEYQITFNQYYNPIIKLNIAGELVSLIVDTGAGSMGLSLDKSIIEKIKDINYTGVDKFSDLAGNTYQVKQYIAPHIKIGSFSYKNLSINEYTQWGLFSENIDKDNHLNAPHNNIRGVIGIKFLYKYPFIIDYQKMKFYILENADTLPSEDYEYSNWQKIRFQLSEDGIRLSVKLEQNLRARLDLDTASNISILRGGYPINPNLKEQCNIKFEKKSNCEYFVANYIQIGEKMFGKQEFYFYDFPATDIDGLLGYSFLEDKIILFNLEEQLFYIK